MVGGFKSVGVDIHLFLRRLSGVTDTTSLSLSPGDKKTPVSRGRRTQEAVILPSEWLGKEKRKISLSQTLQRTKTSPSLRSSVVLSPSLL